MKKQDTDSTKRIVDFEDALLCLHRERFFIRACIFVSISIMAVAYRLLPERGIIVSCEMLIIAALWGMAARNAKKESKTYNDYVKCISPTNAQQLGLKPAPVRGFWSFLLKSWDVTCFFVPFLFFLGFLLVSPARNLDGCVSIDKDFAQCVEVNRLRRVKCISECAVLRRYSIQAWTLAAYNRIKAWVSNSETHSTCGGKECEQVELKSNVD